MQQCHCGGNPVATCTQCQNPLCNQHAYKLYASYPDAADYKRLEAFLNKFPNPTIRSKKFDIATLVSRQLINSYEDRHVCLNCHQQNVQRDADELLERLKRSTIPEDNVDFTLWLLFDSPFRKRIHLSDHNYVPYLSDKELVQFWLRFSRRAQVPLETSSPVWALGGRYVIDLAGKVYDNGSEVMLNSSPQKSTYQLDEWIIQTADSLLADVPEANMLKEEDNETLSEYASALLRQWQQQHVTQQQHYQELTTLLQQTAANIAAAMKRIGIRQDAAISGFFSKTVGWFVWIDSHIVHDQPGEYFGTSYKIADALILSPRGVLYKVTASTGRLSAEPKTIISKCKKLTEVEVTSDQEFRDIQQKLMGFAAQHSLQV